MRASLTALAGLTLFLSGCASDRAEIPGRVFDAAFAAPVERVGADGLKASFTAGVIASSEVPGEREAAFAGLRGALARAALAEGYVAMRTSSCRYDRTWAGYRIAAIGTCTGEMSRVMVQSTGDPVDLREILREAEAVRAGL